MELIETLNRTIKLAMDEGRVGSYEEALALFSSFKLRIVVKPGFSATPEIEACVLTLLNTAPRTFLGGVELVGPLKEQCTKAWFAGETLGDVATKLGVSTTLDEMGDTPTIHTGGGEAEPNTPFWLGITLQSNGFTLSPDEAKVGSETCPIEVGIAAAGAALNEAFHHMYRKTPLAGQREIHWELPCRPNPNPISSLWLIGLGHLGQAFLWALALKGNHTLPGSIRLTDFDNISPSSMSTCLLVNKQDIGQKKVDVVAEKLKLLGVQVQRDYERLELDKAQEMLPKQDLGVVAVDNITLRRTLDRLSTKRTLEAGIGDGPEGFTRIQMHAFPSQRKARDIWSGEDPKSSKAIDISQPAYQALLKTSGDECGTTLVAGRSISTPFIGAFAGAILSALSTDPEIDTHAWSYDVNCL